MTNLANNIVHIAEQFAALPAERDRQIINLIINDSVQSVREAPAGPGRVRVDPDTGKLVNQDEPEGAAHDRQVMQLLAMRESFGAGGNPLSPERQETEERRQTIGKLTGFGAKRPADVDRAMRLVGAAENLMIAPPALNVADLDPDNLRAQFSDYVDAKTRAATAQAERGELHAIVAREMVEATTASVGHYLSDPTIRKAFDAAAESFTRVYPGVRDCRSLTDAAAIDESGNGVVAWHTANRAVAELDHIVGMLLGLVAPRYITYRDGGPQKRTSPGAYLALSAPVPEAGSGVLVRALADHGVEVSERLKINQAPKPGVTGGPDWSPWKQYGAQIDAGAVLSLPADQDDLAERDQSFDPQAEMIAAMLGSTA